MKSILLALTLMTSSTFASEILVDKRIAAGFVRSVSGEFKVNEDMGRAWIELRIGEGWRSTDLPPNPSYERVQVPGLSLQNETIVIDVDGSQVECAYMANVGIFRTRVVRMNGNCEIETRESKEVVDDGFETRRVVVLSTYLIVH
jgi:hypothetical protein